MEYHKTNESQNNYAELKKSQNRQHMLYASFYIKFQKMKLIYTERRQISDYLRMRRGGEAWEERLQMGTQKF